MFSASSYRAAFPSAVSSEAQVEAKSIEDKAYRNAESKVRQSADCILQEVSLYRSWGGKEDYEQACRSVIQEYQNSAAQINQTNQERDDHETSITTGTTIGSYKNAIYHSNGIFSTIYKAKHGDGKVVALKLTRPSAMTPPHNSERESRILQECASSHVVPLIEVFREPGGYYVLVFPFMQNNLEELLGQKVLTLDIIKSHLRDLFSALTYLHSRGIIHRDVKPSNVLVASLSGPAYLADFGIAWSPNDKASEPPKDKITDVGTTSYRPPELLFGHAAYGCSLDIWAAGCVVTEAIRQSNKTLFDSGPLGSELALIQSIFKTLGTPNLDIWPVRLSMLLSFFYPTEGLGAGSRQFSRLGQNGFS